MTNCCAWPGCPEEGTFPAPKNPRDLSQRQFFCAQHIKEFNKRWNGLDGFNESELWSIQDRTGQWQRPSWTSAETTAQPKAQKNPRAENVDPRTRIFRDSADLYGFFNSRLAREMNGEFGAAPQPRRSQLPADVKAACAIFSLEYPQPEPILKKRYLNLVKQHHPDVNKSPHAPEQIKQINVAYKILRSFAEREGLQTA